MLSPEIDELDHAGDDGRGNECGKREHLRLVADEYLNDTVRESVTVVHECQAEPREQASSKHGASHTYADGLFVEAKLLLDHKRRIQLERKIKQRSARTRLAPPWACRKVQLKGRASMTAQQHVRVQCVVQKEQNGWNDLHTIREMTPQNTLLRPLSLLHTAWYAHNTPFGQQLTSALPLIAPAHPPSTVR